MRRTELKNCQTDWIMQAVGGRGSFTHWWMLSFPSVVQRVDPRSGSRLDNLRQLLLGPLMAYAVGGVRRMRRAVR